MAGNTFGKLFRLTTFGESHGPAIGGVIDGCPPGLHIDREFVQAELDRRKPGQSAITTKRTEADKVEFISGIFESRSTGTPIAFIIRNKDQKSKDYDALKHLYRPSHADFTYMEKYGIRDHRGGGRSSARETASRVVGGAIAKLYLNQLGISFTTYVHAIGSCKLNADYLKPSFEAIESSIVRCPDKAITTQMEAEILHAKDSGDSLGGIISCVISGMPAGLGNPVFDKLNADLAKAMFSINAVKGFEIGSGFASANMKGSEHNDAYKKENGRIITESNYSGGIQGGISNGQDVLLKVAFKPVASIGKEMKTLDDKGDEVDIKIEGRHDPCVVPRAVPIVESMAALVVIDHYLLQKSLWKIS